MCGRFALAKKKKEIIKEYEERYNLKITDLSTIGYEENYNITPGQEVSIIYGQGLDLYFNFHRWGLIPPWSKDKKGGVKMINARMETVAEKPSFKKSFFWNRCLILADGYYEWLTKGKEKIPYYFELEEKRLFAFAGLRAVWQDSVETIASCSIITTRALGKLADIHHRMPIILKPEGEMAWLNPEIREEKQLFEILNNNANTYLNFYQVSNKVNNPRNNSPDLIKPVFTQMELF